MIVFLNKFLISGIAGQTYVISLCRQKLKQESVNSRIKVTTAHLLFIDGVAYRFLFFIKEALESVFDRLFSFLFCTVNSIGFLN